jgi:hypothetical protein
MEKGIAGRGFGNKKCGNQKILMRPINPQLAIAHHPIETPTFLSRPASLISERLPINSRQQRD